ncbi:MAG: hypothetical protein EB015_08340 [Methylocystaceae bacterium]|nr:hypothetical protein [Methylocystaceae bacterium]
MTVHFLPPLKTPLWVRLAIPISLVIALALGLISFLNYYVFEKTYKDLNVSRITVVARDLRQLIETGLNIGLSPQSNVQFSSAARLAREITEGINFIIVVDDKGRRLIEVGEALENPDWARKFGASPWTSEDQKTYQIGLPYRNSFGIVVGTLILGYDRNAIVTATNDMRMSLITDWVYDALIVSILTFAGIFLLTRSLKKELSLIEESLKTPLSETHHFDFETPIMGADFKSGLISFSDHIREAFAKLKGPKGDMS